MRRHFDRHRRRVRVVTWLDVLAVLSIAAWLVVVAGLAMAVVGWIGGGM